MSVERRLPNAPNREGNPDFVPSSVTRAGKDREMIRVPCRSLPLLLSESKFAASGSFVLPMKRASEPRVRP